MTALRRIAVAPRLGVSFLLWALAGAGLGLALAVAAPFVIGHRSFTVLSGSMEPAIATGDIVVDDSIAPVDARVGDVVTFSDPTNSGRMITHRVRSVRADGGQVNFVTKGDANNAVERWSVAGNGRIGRVVYRVPMLGYALARTRRLGAIFLVAIPALLLGAYELVRIWRTPAPPKETTGGLAG